MSTQGSFNTKNPTIKRILKEASELSTLPTSDYAAAPLETNLFEWHFTLRGPPSPSPYSNGLYHGRIVLPPSYPLRPPSFRFLTPSGRFEVNREICLSISGHHEESWQPAWGIRTALVAIRSFMDSDAKGQVGGIDSSSEVRSRLARESRSWRCSGCAGKTNEAVMLERERDVQQLDKKEMTEDKIPEELKLGYRDELGDASGKDSATQLPRPSMVAEGADRTSPTGPIAVSEGASTTGSTGQDNTVNAAHPGQTATRHHGARSATSTTNWLDMAIGGVAAALLVLILRRLAHVL